MARTLNGVLNAAQLRKGTKPYLRIDMESKGVIIEDCEDNWQDNANATATTNTDRVRGDTSIRTAIGASFTTGVASYEDISGDSVDISGQTHVSLWVKSSIAVNKGNLQILLDDSKKDCSTPNETLDVPTLLAGVWTRVHLKLSVPSANSAVQSVGLNIAKDLGACNVFVDDIRGTISYSFDTKNKRIKAVRQEEEAYSGMGRIILSNKDSYFSARDLRGYRLWLHWGLDVAKRFGYVITEPLWVYNQRYLSATSTRIVELNCIGIWQALSIFTRMGDDVVAPVIYDIDTAPQTIIEEAGDGYFVLTEDNTDTSDLPANARQLIATQVNESRASVIRRALSCTLSGMRMSHDKMHMLYLDADPTTDHTFNIDGQKTFYNRIKGQSMVVPNRITYAEALPTPDFTPGNMGTSANDTTTQTWAGLGNGIVHGVRDGGAEILSDAVATARATSAIHRLRLATDLGGITAPMNFDMEVLDHTTAVDPRDGVTCVGRVGKLQRYYDPLGYFGKKKRWNIEFDLGNMRAEGLEIQSIQKNSKVWRTLFDGSADSPTATDWGWEASIPFTISGYVYFSPIFYDSTLSSHYVFIIDEGLHFYKYVFGTLTWKKLANPPYNNDGTIYVQSRSLVPDNMTTPTKLYTIGDPAAANGGGGQRILTYTIATNSWASGSKIYSADIKYATSLDPLALTAKEAVTAVPSGATGYMYSHNVGNWITLMPDSITDFAINDVVTGGASGRVATLDSLTLDTKNRIRSIAYVNATTIYCWAADSATSTDGVRLEMYKYNPTADTWTMFSGNYVDVSGSEHGGAYSASKKGDNTIIYASHFGDAVDWYVTYTVAGDTYNKVDGVGNTDGYTYSYHDDRLWYFDTDDMKQGYLDTSDNSANDDHFAENTGRNTGLPLSIGVNDAGDTIIGYSKTTNPYLMSVRDGGANQLGGAVLITSSSTLVIDKPNDGYDVTIQETNTNRTITISTYQSIDLTPGTWVFYYPQDGDYAKILIQQSVDYSAALAEGFEWSDEGIKPPNSAYSLIIPPVTVAGAESGFSEGGLTFESTTTTAPSSGYTPEIPIL